MDGGDQQMTAPAIEPLATAVTADVATEPPAAAAQAPGHDQRPGDGIEEWAICCSGGGIRSASYCLGALQRIEEDRLLAPGSQISLDKVSMIVGVSGGSYITASRAVVANGPALSAGQPAYAPGSPEEQHLRENTNYLVPDAKTLLAGVLSLLFGVAATLLLFLTPLFAVSHAWGWLLRSQGVLKYAVAAHTHTLQVTAAVTGISWWITPVIAAGITFLAFLWWWITLIPSPGGQEGHSQVAVTVLGWLAFLTVVIAVAMLAVPELIAWLAGPHSGALKTVLDDLGFGAGAAWTPAAVGGFVAAVVAVAQSARKSLAAYEQLKAPPGNQQASSGLLASVATYLRALVMPWLASVLVLLAGFIAALRWVKDGAAAAGFNRDQLWLVIGAVAVMLVTRILADVNRISLHDFYRWRLATAYAVQRDPESSSRIENIPGALLSGLSRQQPKPVLCTTANINARREVPVGRGGLSFTFDPDNATLRGPDPGEQIQASTRDYEIVVGERRFTLFDVSAISGAAFSPLMGATTRQAYRILFTAANLRLGVWLPHPAVVKAAREVKDKDELSWWRAVGLLFWYVLPHPFWRYGNNPDRNSRLEAREAGLWAHVLRLRQDGSGFRQFLGGLMYHALQPTLGMLYAEAAGHTSYRSTWMCVTDGGHYDNLGVVEALKRGARRILVLDASGDKANTWFTIGGAIAQARSDARTEIELNPQTMCTPPDGLDPGQVVTPSVDGTFTRYSPSGPPVEGAILVCKLGWWENAPWDIRAYAAGHPSYPADPTIEQLYDSAEFDAYRELGSASVGLAIQNGKLENLIKK
ncbi:MAG TPA: hypothetical protein VF070_02730 [Streptosporangiaceae bacterium]